MTKNDTEKYLVIHRRAWFYGYISINIAQLKSTYSELTSYKVCYSSTIYRALILSIFARYRENYFILDKILPLKFIKGICFNSVDNDRSIRS